MNQGASWLALAAAIACALALGACAGTDWARVHQTALDARNDLNDASDAVEAVAPTIRALCGGLDRHPLCQGAEAAYEVARNTIDAGQATIDAFNATGVSLEAAEAAVLAAAEARAAVDAAVEALRGHR